MEHLINKKVRDIEISGIRKFYNLVSQYKDAISLTIGQPDFKTPEHIKNSAKLALDSDKTTYTQNAGLLELRTAAKDYVKFKYNLDYSEDEIIVTNGASEAIDTSLRTILEEDSEVILPGPIYPGYEPIIKLCGAKPVYIDVTGSNFKLKADKIKEKLNNKTRCIIIPYPSNPTGTVLTKDELYEIAYLIKDKDIFILSDEIYSELTYDIKHNSIASIKDVKDKTIVINGLSKSHSMTGFRIGFMFAPSYITKHALKVHQYNSTCACTISQYAAYEALKFGFNDSNNMKEEYKKRRDYVYERLINMGFEVEKPDGAFYIFPSIKKFNMTSFDFALKLLEVKRVAVVPGSAFSEYGEGYIRISYAYSLPILEDGLNKIEQFIKSL